jgi:hypothetical protein
VDHIAEDQEEDIAETLLRMGSDPRIVSNNSGRNEHADSVIQKMSISITKMRNAYSASFRNKGKLSRAGSPVHARTINASLLPRSNVHGTWH